MLTQFRLTRQDLRLGSGLILFAYVAAHFANHALGLISVAAAERGLRVAVAVWHSLPGTVLLYGAAGIHIALAFVALYEHRTMRMPPMEWLRIVLGFGIPTLLIAHAVTTRLAFEAYGAQPSYARIVWSWRWPAVVLGYTYVAGYVAAFVVYRVAGLFGMG